MRESDPLGCRCDVGAEHLCGIHHRVRAIRHSWGGGVDALVGRAWVGYDDLPPAWMAVVDVAIADPYPALHHPQTSNRWHTAVIWHVDDEVFPAFVPHEMRRPFSARLAWPPAEPNEHGERAWVVESPTGGRTLYWAVDDIEVRDHLADCIRRWEDARDEDREWHERMYGGDTPSLPDPGWVTER